MKIKKPTLFLIALFVLMLALTSCSAANDRQHAEHDILTTVSDETEITAESFTEQIQTETLTSAPASETTLDTEVAKVRVHRPAVTEILNPEPEAKVEQNEDTELALQFIMDYINANLNMDPSLIDLDSYIDNEYLKGFIKGNLELVTAIKNQTQQRDMKKITYKIIESKTVNEINYIKISCHYEYYIGAVTTQANGAKPTVAVKDGKIVNFNEYLFKVIPESALCDDITSSMAWKGYDLSEHSHLWDDNKAYNVFLEKFEEAMTEINMETEA